MQGNANFLLASTFEDLTPDELHDVENGDKSFGVPCIMGFTHKLIIDLVDPTYVLNTRCIVVKQTHGHIFTRRYPTRGEFKSLVGPIIQVIHVLCLRRWLK